MKDEFIKDYDYYSELNNFSSYIKDIKKSDTNITILGGIRTRDILESIDYNIKYNNYSSRSIAFKYATAIAQFYRVATTRKWFENDNLIEDINKYSKLDDESYFSQINTYILNNKKLKFKSSKDAYNEYEINDLIDAIDEYIDVNVYFVNKNIKPKHLSKIGYEKIGAMLAIKVMIFTGIKYGAARNLKLTDSDDRVNTIGINGYSIRLPINLSKQFIYYTALKRELKLISNIDDYLFTSYDGKQWGEKTHHSKIIYVIEKVLLRQDTLGLTKYGIGQLIKAGTGLSEIEKLTGAKKDVIRGCVPESKESEEEKINKYYNSHITKTDIYYKL